MSLENVNARISELQARIDSLTARMTLPSLSGQQASLVDPVDSQMPPSDSKRPFDVALLQATGQVQLRPLPVAPSGKSTPNIEGLIDKYSALYQLDPHLVRAVITAESDGDPTSVSKKGAMGLMQLMPDEVKGYGIHDPFDPEQNIAGGTRQLAEKLKLFNGDVKLALAAYNAGSHAVQKYGGVPPFTETQNYVKRILGMLPEKR